MDMDNNGMEWKDKEGNEKEILPPAPIFTTNQLASSERQWQQLCQQL